MYAILEAAIAWESARQALLALSIGAADYHAHLNALSGAEDGLQHAVKAWRTSGIGPKEDRLQRIIMRASAGVVTSQQLGAELGISDRTVYRLVRILQKQGVPIVGEAGMGYMICRKGMRNGDRHRNQVD